MKEKEFKISQIFIIVVLLLIWNNSFAVNNEYNSIHQTDNNHHISITLEHTSGYYMRQDSLVDDFEDGMLDPWTLGGNYNWAIRDTTNTYGPNEPAVSGYRYAGIPQNDVAGYTGNKDGQLISPTINLTGWDSLYLAFNYWADLEGEASNFDGFIIEISPDDGTTWLQIDSLAQGHLDPTYDEECAGVGEQPLGNAWCYCYDTGEGDSTWWWINVVSRDLIDLGYVATGDQIKLRFYFGSDPASQGQGLFIDDVHLTSYSPPDLQAPVIDHTPLSDTTDTLNAYTISADVTDEGSGVDSDSVYLYCKIEDGTWVSEKMINVSGDTYEAVIPPQDWHTDIYYYIEAVDLASSPNIATTPIYIFEITDAVIIIYDDGQPWWNPSDLAPNSGIFNNFSLSDVALDSGIVHKAIFYFRSFGPYDLEIYDFALGWPGDLLDSLLGLESPGAGWRIVDLEPLGLHVTDNVLIGWIARFSGNDTTRVLMDGTMEHPQIQWGLDLQGVPGWTQTPYTGGDFMIRLKVLPLPRPAPGVEEDYGNRPTISFALEKAVPNPTRKNTIIEFQIPTAQNVSLRIYDATGQLVKTLINALKEAGTHSVIWNGLDEHNRPVANGVYFYRLQGETNDITRKLVITR